MWGLEFLNVSCSTVATIIGCVIPGMILSRYLSEPVKTEQGLSFITLRVLLSCMLFANLCHDVSSDFLQKYFWAAVMSLVPMVLGIAFSLAVRKLVPVEWRVLLVLGSTFQNGLAFPLSVVSNIKGVNWMEGEAVLICQRYVFLYNLTCALGLWSFGNLMVKHYKDKLMDKHADILEKQENLSRTVSSSLMVGERRLSSPSRLASVVITSSSPEVAEANGDVLGKGIEETEGSGYLDTPENSLQWYRPPGRRARPIDARKYQKAVKQGMARVASATVPSTTATATTTSFSLHIPSVNLAREDDTMNDGSPLEAPQDSVGSVASSQAASSELPSGPTTPRQQPQRGTIPMEVSSMELRLRDRPVVYRFRYVCRIVWSVLQTPPILLSLLGIAVSLLPPLRWLSETAIGHAAVHGVELVGSGCVPVQLVTLGIILSPNKVDTNVVPGGAAYSDPGGEEEERRITEELDRHAETSCSSFKWIAEPFRVLRRKWQSISAAARLCILCLLLRLLVLPAASFLIVHVLLVAGVMPSDGLFVVSVLVGISSPAAVNASLLCTMHGYYPRQFARMIFVMYGAAIVTSTIWISASISYASGMSAPQ